MANTPRLGEYSVNAIGLEPGGNTIKVSSSAATLKLGMSNPTTLAEEVVGGELEYDMKADGTYAVKGPGNMSGKIKIPSRVGDVIVTEIAENAFRHHTTLTEVRIPNTVKTIGRQAFQYSSVELVEFEDIDEIVLFFKNTPGWLYPCVVYERHSGYGTNTRQELIRLNDTQDIYCCAVPLDVSGFYFTSRDGGHRTETQVVEKNSNTLSVLSNAMIIPGSSLGVTDGIACKTEYYYDLGSNAPELHNKIPSGLYIGQAAFQFCTSLKTMVIPRRVTCIGLSAFMGCDSLTALNVADYSRLMLIEDSAFSRCGSMESINIPDSLAVIGSSAFQECASIVNFNYKPALKEIKARAFKECTSLKTFDLVTGAAQISSRLARIGDETFYNCKGLGSNANIGYYQDPNKYQWIEPYYIRMPASLEYIGNRAFFKTASEGLGIANSTRPYFTFENVYTWFLTNNSFFDPETAELIPPGSMPTNTAPYVGKEPDAAPQYMYRLDKMPPPEVYLENGVLYLTDRLGVAEQFHIYVGKDATEPTIDFKPKNIT